MPRLFHGNRQQPQLQRSTAGRPRLEVLEDRSLLSTCTVDQLTDTVAGGGRPGELRYCINQTEPGDDILIEAAGTIELRGRLPMLRADLFGLGADQSLVQRTSGGGYPIFTIPADATVEIAAVAITNGQDTNGGCLQNAGTLTVRDSVISSCTAAGTAQVGGKGGAIYSTGILEVSGSYIGQSNVVAPQFGGSQGGAIWSNRTLAVRDSYLEGNLADRGWGGGIYNDGELELTSSVLVANQAGGIGLEAGQGGGGLHNALAGTAVVNWSWFLGNVVVGNGGAIHNLGALSIYGSTFNGANSAGYPTAALGNGGAIYNGQFLNNPAHMEVSHSTIEGNVALRGGGLANAGSLGLAYSTVANNTADNTIIAGEGGGVHNVRAMLIINSTISGNRALFSGFGGSGLGGGIFSGGTLSDSRLELLWTTLANNEAQTSGGGLFIADAARFPVSARNTLSCNNAAPNGPDVHGRLASLGTNLVCDSRDSSGYEINDLLDYAPKEVLDLNLADNGGLTLTHALVLGGPAVDTGSADEAPDWDQRGDGYLRAAGLTSDIGAYEDQGGLSPQPGNFQQPGFDAIAWLMKKQAREQPDWQEQTLSFDPLVNLLPR